MISVLARRARRPFASSLAQQTGALPVPVQDFENWKPKHNIPEVVQQTNRPNHFTVVEIWKDAKAVAAHSMAAGTRRFRDALATATGALYDERKYRAVE